MDRRVRARRIAVRRAEGRRRLAVTVVLLAVAGLAAAVWALVHSPLLAVATIDVRGARLTNPATVRAVASSVDGDPLLTVDLGRLAEQVEALPWVDSATVTRQWPRSVRVAIVERVPAASLYQSDGTWSLVDAAGRILQSGPNQPAGLVPVVAGGAVVPLGGQLEGWRRAAVEAAAHLAPALTTGLASVTLDPEGGIVLALEGGGAVWLGDASDLATKQIQALGVLSALADAPVGVIDVRVPAAPSHRPPLTSTPG